MGMMSNGSGVRQWVFQRISNALFVAFAVFLAYNIMCGVTYESLQVLMSNTLVKVYLAVTLLFAFANSILAGWQIEGDYAQKFSIPKGLMLGFTILVSLGYLVFGISVLF